MTNFFDQFKLSTAETQAEVDASMADLSDAEVELAYEKELEAFRVGNIVQGEIVGIFDDEVAVNIGYKSEGFVPAGEFDNPLDREVGRKVHVFIVMMEGPNGMVILSKKKADLAFGWRNILDKHKVGDVTSGKAIRKIKGGLLVDIGVPVFMPASQIDIRRRPDIASYIGEDLECKIIKIDEEQKNIVVSRRRLIEERRETAKQTLLATLEKGQMRKGVVKNITDFGAFIDLGGIDGLLHITDMSWSRVSHPSEIVALDEEVEVMILDFDKVRERISLGLKQKSPNPWRGITDKYAPSATVPGEVVNILPYGAFVKIEDGVEGLVHISEMSWTKRIKHPSEVVNIGDKVTVMVLNIDEEKQEISLGMKQTEKNPWEMVRDKFPIGAILKGKVRNLTSYGAFVEIDEGVDGLLHVSDMSWTKKITHPKEMLHKGDEVNVKVLAVDQDKKRVSLGMKQLEINPWDTIIPEKYRQGLIVEGVISKLTSFGAFVELERDLEGLLHISELAERKVAGIEDVLKIGDKVYVKILELDKDEKKLRLSLRNIPNPEIEERISKLNEAGESPERAAKAEKGEAPPAEAAPAAEKPVEPPTA
ncbi:MAG: 30S ribosomal protein S1 [Planctomycetota bacterium]